MIPLHILIIEDDPIEVMKLKRVLNSLKLSHVLTEATNGEEALNIFQERTVIPDIILLDLNMPKINGIEFLSHLKSDEHLKYIPTIILTTSNNPSDLLECYKIGIAGYILKPLKYEDYVRKMETLLAYWSINQLVKV